MSEAEKKLDAASDSITASAAAEGSCGDQPVSPDPGPAGQAVTLESLQKQVGELTAQAQAAQDRYLRTLADLDNYRRRMSREKDDIRWRTASELLSDLLPALDNLGWGLESARQHHPEAKAVIDGIANIQDQLVAALTRHDVQEFRPVQQAFDPSQHECVAHLPDASIPEGNIVTVVRPGYRYGDRLLRPAAVTVSSGPAPANPSAPVGAA